MSDERIQTLRDIVEDVFISPVRSVLLVDDEYPTLDLMLDGYIDSQDVWSKTKGTAKESARRVAKILNFCRSDRRNWLVDVHDGQNVEFGDEAQSVSHLHQSDLLFLDLHLEGDSESTEKCINILKHLANSDHFNLVVVVTKTEISEAIEQILPEFVPQRFNADIDIAKKDQTESALEDWSDKDDSIIKNLNNCISLTAFVNISKVPINKIGAEEPNVEPYIGDFLTLWDAKPNDIELEVDDLLIWVLQKAECQLNIKGSADHHLEHSSMGAAQPWLCDRNVFLTVHKKSESDEEGQNILDSLIAAMVDWQPTANRLILAKLRSEVESRGISVGEEIFTEREMQADWLHKMVAAKPEEQKSAVDIIVSRYCEALISYISYPIRDTVISSLALETGAEVLQRSKAAFGVDLSSREGKQLAALQHNIVVSNCRISGWHLQPGHIFLRDDEFWMILTPSCDLVPLKSRKRSEHLCGLMPFKAVKLRKIENPTTGLRKANQNLTTFIYHDGKPILLHFLTGNSSNSEVHWNEFFAKNHGKLTPPDYTSEVATVTHDDDDKFHTTWFNVRIVAQLRYEYAINLLQVLASRTSRVGLDFVQ